MASVIETDNFGRSGEAPGLDERLVVAGIRKETAIAVARLLNEEGGDSARTYYRVELNEFEGRLAKFKE